MTDVEGEARVSIAQVFAGPHFALRPPERVVVPDLGLDLGVSIIRLDGKAAAAFEDRTDHIVGFTARIGAGLAFSVHKHVAIRIDGAVGVAAPTPQVAFAGRTVARWSAPYGAGSAGVQFNWGRP